VGGFLFFLLIAVAILTTGFLQITAIVILALAAFLFLLLLLIFAFSDFYLC